MKEMWVGYNVRCTMGLLLGHSAWQIDRPSNGSMWNSYSFQPIDPWMGYPFTDLGAEGCCRSLNALFLVPALLKYDRKCKGPFYSVYSIKWSLMMSLWRKSQGISSLGIHLVIPELSVLSTRRVNTLRPKQNRTFCTQCYNSALD